MALGIDRHLALVGLERGRGPVKSLVDLDGWFVILGDCFGVRGCGFALA